MDQIVEKKDVSKQTISVLVFLAILVSLLGTLTVMQEVGKVKAGQNYYFPDGNSESSGEVRLNIVPPGYDAYQNQGASSVGTVSMVIRSSLES